MRLDGRSVLLSSPGVLVKQQPPLRRTRRSRHGTVRVAAWWSPMGKGGADDTDDDILTAAAVTKHEQAHSSTAHTEGRHGVQQPGFADDSSATRPTVLSFAASLTFITAGAFFVGSMVRKYIMQPTDGSNGSSGVLNGGKGRLGSRRHGGTAAAQAGGKGVAPSVQDLLAHGTGGSMLSSEDTLLSSAAKVPAENQAAAAAAAAQARAAAAAAEPSIAQQGLPAPLAAAAAAAAAKEGASAPAKTTQPAPGAQQAAQVPTADLPQQQQQPRPQRPDTPSSEAAPAQQVGATLQTPRQPPQGQQEDEAEPSQAAEPKAESWCEQTLAPAVAAADAAASEAAPAAAAALEAAAPVLACESIWILSRPVEGGGSVALRLLFPVAAAGGEEQNCVALFEVKGDAQAAARLLDGLLGLTATPQRVPAAQMAAEAGKRRWGLAFYAAGSVAAALAPVEAAALQQQEQGEQQQEGKQQGEQQRDAVAGEAGEERQASGGAGEGDGEAQGQRQDDPVDLLQAVLQRQALLLSGGQMQAVAASLKAASKKSSGGGGSSSGGGAGASGSSSGAAAGGGAPAAAPDVQQQPEQAADQGQAQAVQQGASQAQQAQQAAPGWDPATDRMPRRQDDPSWWLKLPVLHVPQLVYADGAKGLMSVPLAIPSASPQTSGAAPGNGSSSAGGGGGGAAAAAEGAGQERVERRLVAFAELKDAEALVECSMQAGTGAVDIQVVSVPPAQLAQHASANGCGVAALSGGELALPPGTTTYDDAVAAVVGAVEAQFYRQVVHAAGELRAS